MPLNIVLYQPEIPANTGTIGRSCVLTGTRLHLIEPLGFSLDDRMVRRSGMGYWHDIDLRVYGDLQEFLERNPRARERMWLSTKHAATGYHQVGYEDGDYLMFGRESTGIDQEVLDAFPDRLIGIPMLRRKGVSPVTTRDDVAGKSACEDPDAVSLNLSNAANIVLFEALRQLGFPFQK